VKYLKAWTNRLSWQDIEYFDESWKTRIAAMAKYIPGSANSLLDLGCGQMWLKEMIGPALLYTGVDYIQRDVNTLVFDFNKHQFPEKYVDVMFASGCLEYVEDPSWFTERMSHYGKTCILSYCTLEDFPFMQDRKTYCWKNHLKKEEVIRLFSERGLHLDIIEKTAANNTIFVFNKK
jgi:hypothetical protein